MKSNFPIIIFVSFFVYLGLIGLVGCSDSTTPSTTPVLQKELAKSSQPSPANSASKMTANANNTLVTNTQTQPIQPANNNETISTHDAPPREAIDVALSAATKDCIHECKNYKVAEFTECQITPANKENGIDEEWSIFIRWIERDKADGKWFDRSGLYKILRENGKWILSERLPGTICSAGRMTN